MSARAAVGDSTPSVCTIEDVCRILALSRRTCERLLAAHALPLIELPRIGRIRRFRGESVDAIRAGRFSTSLRRAS